MTLDQKAESIKAPPGQGFGLVFGVMTDVGRGQSPTGFSRNFYWEWSLLHLNFLLTQGKFDFDPDDPNCSI